MLEPPGTIWFWIWKLCVCSLQSHQSQVCPRAHTPLVLVEQTHQAQLRRNHVIPTEAVAGQAVKEAWRQERAMVEVEHQILVVVGILSRESNDFSMVLDRLPSPVVAVHQGHGTRLRPRPQLSDQDPNRD